MTVSRVVRIFLLLALPLAICSSGSAASVSGKVADIFDGNSFAIISGNHPLKVKLIGVAAPEKSQAFADIARQHLADLIRDKFVTVHFSALEDGFLLGQVFSGEMDVSAQMIRDGAAWYDKSDARLLSDSERQIYGGSQDAARSERRGLWQEESPVSPWDYRNAQLVKSKTTTVTPTPSLANASRQAATPSLRKESASGLSSEDLMGGVLRPGSVAGKPEVKQLSASGAPGRWLRYQPPDRHFSILAPSDGIEVTVPLVDEQGKLRDLHQLMGKSGATIYFLVWFKAPNGNSTDASTAADAMNSMLAGLNRSIARTGVIAEASPGRLVKLADYAGKQYDLNVGAVSGVVRVLSKQIGDEREMFFLCVLNTADSDTAGAEFLNSLKIRPSTASSGR